jgi:signal transduction histidine kinase
VQLRRRRSGHELIVEVTDDGVGFDASAAQPGHLGLRTMAERMEQLGGSLLVDTRPGRGTRIAAMIPLSPLGTRLAMAAGLQPVGGR